MDYTRRSYEPGRETNDRDDDFRNRRSPDRYRNRDFDEEYRGYNRNIASSRSYEEPDYRGDIRSSDWRDRNEYSDRYPASTSYSGYYENREYYGQGTKRSHLRCRDIMTRNVITCRKDTSTREVAKLMSTEDVGSIPVLDEVGKLEGIVTDRDLVIKGLTSTKTDLELKAEDCMSTDLFTAHQNERVVSVIREMADHQVRRIPVVDSRNRLVGIISMADVATQTNRDKELADALEEISKPSSWFGRLTHFLGF